MNFRRVILVSTLNETSRRRSNFRYLIVLFSLFATLVRAQDQSTKLHYTPFAEGNPTYPVLSLADCISEAMKQQASIQQARIDQAIARTNKVIALSEWLPQVAINANYQRFLELPTAFLRVNDVLTPIRTGVANSSTPQLTATQQIFNAEALQGSKTARIAAQVAEENAQVVKMDVVVAITRTYYDVLLSAEKVKVYQQDTARLQKNRNDAYHRFVSGVADKVDYMQATIALNNATTQLKSALEATQAAYAQLRLYTGIPTDRPFRVQFDTGKIMQEVDADTSLTLKAERRPEFRRLLLYKQLQGVNTAYYKTGFLPSLYAFYNYNYQFQNNNFYDLYSRAYPNSFLGLQLNLPLFTGFRRLENVHKSKLQEERVDWDIVNLSLDMYAAYRQAMAIYKNNLYSYHTQAENRGIAREVYNIVKLQYNEGIKPYLDVIVAQTDLQTAEINFQNALFELLKSKADLERAVGITPIAD